MDTTPEKKKSGRSCFLYGCLTLVVLFIAAVAILYFGVRYYVNSSIQQFTEATPLQFEPATLPDDENTALKARIQEFDHELQGTNQVAHLTLDSRELNALIANEPKLTKLKDSLRVKLDGKEVQCQFSTPLDSLAKTPVFGRLFLSGCKGRFLNATANVQVMLENGNLETRITGATVKKMALPSEFLAQIEKNPSWEQFQQSPDMKKLLGKIDWLKIQDSKVELGTGKPAP